MLTTMVMVISMISWVGISSEVIAFATFTITANITLLTPVSGTIGTTITISGNGYDSSELIKIDFGKTSTITTVTADLDGVFSSIFEADSQSSGTVTITAIGLTTGARSIALFELRGIKPLPDLMIEGLSFKPVPPLELGIWMRIQVKVANRGEVKAKNIKIRLYEDGIKIDEMTIGGNILPGKIRYTTTWWKPRIRGTLTITAVADPDNLIEKQNENNNELSETILVKLSKNKGVIAGKVFDKNTNKPIQDVSVIVWGRGFG